MEKIVYASIDGVVAHAGLRIKLNPGEAWDAEDSLVRARPDLFTDAPVLARTMTGHRAVSPVETATARPSEKRTTRSPGRSKRSKATTAKAPAAPRGTKRA